MAQFESSNGKLRDDEASTLAQTIGGAAASRIPLEVSLAALAEERSDPRLASTARRLSTRLQQGASIDEAIRDLGDHLPRPIAGVLKAGIESGDLAGSFERFSEQQLEAGRFNRRIRSTLAYPAIILVILVPILLFLSIWVVPMFADLYRDFNMDLPPMTEVIIEAAKQTPRLILGIAIVVIGVPLVLRVIGASWLVHRIRAAIPFLGRLWMWAGQREFTSQLASFVSLGLPLPTALAHTSQVMNDRNVARACDRASQRVEAGQSLSNSLARSIHFDRSLVTLVHWGEKHGALPEALAVATDLFDDHVEQHASLVRRLLPPLTLVSVASIMFCILIGLMIPMVQLIEGLSR